MGLLVLMMCTNSFVFLHSMLNGRTGLMIFSGILLAVCTLLFDVVRVGERRKEKEEIKNLTKQNLAIIQCLRNIKKPKN